MGEVLRLEAQLENYQLCAAASRPVLAEDIFSTFIDPSNDESLDTVTLSAEMIQRLQVRLVSFLVVVVAS